MFLKNKWKITYMSDYPYSNTIEVKGVNEEKAWNNFEKKTGIKKIS